MNQKSIQILSGHLHYVMDIAIDPENPMLLYSAALDRQVYLWDLTTGKVIRETLPFDSGLNSVLPLSGNREPGVIICGDRGLLVAQLPSSKNPPPAKDPFDYITYNGHSHNVNQALQVNADTFMTASEDGTIRVWNIYTNAQYVYTLGHGRIWKIAKVPNYPYLYAAANDDGACFFEFKDFINTSLKEVPFTRPEPHTREPKTESWCQAKSPLIGGIIIFLWLVGCAMALFWQYPKKDELTALWGAIMILGCIFAAVIFSLLCMGIGVLGFISYEWWKKRRERNSQAISVEHRYAPVSTELDKVIVK